MNQHSSYLRIAAPATLLSLAAFAVVGCNGLLNKDDEPSTNFVFANEPAAVYSQVDRVGMPAVATAFITDKNAYNAAKPADDASGMFVSEITGNLDAIHAKLNDDISHAGLVPTDTSGSLGNAAAAVVPDTLKLDTTAPAGFPNGRLLTDRVVDMTLSLVLLQQGGSQDINTLANLPLNPGANDKPFQASFPYLAAPF